MRQIITLIAVLSFGIVNGQTAEDYFELGNLNSEEGNSLAATVNYSLAIEENPYNYLYYNYRGVIYLRSKSYEAALKDFKELIKLNPTYYIGYKCLGETYFGLNNFKEAALNYSLTIKYYDNPPPGKFSDMVLSQIYHEKGKANLYSGNKIDACEDFKKAVQLSNNLDSKKMIESNCKEPVERQQAPHSSEQPNVMSQDLTIEETIDYINKQLKENQISYKQEPDPSNFFSDGKPTYVISLNVLSLTNDGKILIKVYDKTSKVDNLVLDSEEPQHLFYVQEVYIEELIPVAEKNSVNEFSFGLDIHCRDEENKKCVKWDIKDGSFKGIKYMKGISVIFKPDTRLADKLKKAFEYLIKKAQLRQNNNIENDPFANRPTSDTESSSVIKMIKRPSGVFEIPVDINGVLKINFILDSGASEVSISSDIASTLIKSRTIKEEDFIGSAVYTFADGSTSRSKRFIIRELKIGNHTLKNITASISSSINAPMLIGQNVLNELGKVTIDYKTNTLFIKKK